MKKFVNESWLVLAMGIVFALLLAGTQGALKGKIDANRQAEFNDAVKKLVEGTVNAEEVADFEAIEGVDGVYKCMDANDDLVGWVVKARGGGFVDKIVLVVGFPVEADKVLGIKVLENVETPGLGARITEAKFSDQYKGILASQTIEVLKGNARHDAGQVDAITGATWSSRFVTAIVNKVTEDVAPKLKVLAVK